jgi:6-phosphogluconolactonase
VHVWYDWGRWVACGAALLAMAALPADAQGTGGRIVLFAATGPELSHYAVDLGRGELHRSGGITLPSNVQYAWPHPSRRFLYVAWSSGTNGDLHGLTALRIDPVTGGLTRHGPDVALPWRPIHTTVDPRGEHVLVAFNAPSTARVYRLAADLSLEADVPLAAPLDAGSYAHQIRVTPSGGSVFVVARGNEPTSTTAEAPGAVKIFDYAAGVLTNRATIAPGGGYGFQPRHLDFHPTERWIYLAVERQNRIELYRYDEREAVDPLPAYSKTTLDDPQNVRPGQTAGPIHVHPNGRFVYLGNRASGTVEDAGTRVAAGGENTIAVFRIDGESGEPILVDNVDAHGFHPRTFAIDEGGRLLIAANTAAMTVRQGERLVNVPANLAIFAIRDDGRSLEFLRRYDLDPGGGTPFWVGFITLPPE